MVCLIILSSVYVSPDPLVSTTVSSTATETTGYKHIELEALPWLKEFLNREFPITPMTVEFEGIQQPPSSPVRTPAEFEPCQGVLIYWDHEFAGVLDRILLSMVQHIDPENTIFIGVRNEQNFNTVESLLINEHCALDNISFFTYSSNLFWMRDCGPFFVYDSDDRLVGIDTKYIERLTASDGLPPFFCQHYCFDCYDFDFKYDGGNFMTDGKGLLVSTDYFHNKNPELTSEQADSLMATYFGCDRFLVFQVFEECANLAHIDMWAKFLNANTVLVAKFMDTEAVEYALLENAATIFSTLKTYTGSTFDVLRVPMYKVNSVSSYCTYVNSLILDKQVFVPVYDSPTDSEALATYQTALPDYEIIPISCLHFAPRFGGAIHCITREIPESIHPPEVSVLAVSTLGGSIGDTLFPSFAITNPEARTFTYEVTATDTRGWTLNPDSFALSLQACTDTTLEIMCLIPTTATEGMVNTVTLTATAQSDPLAKDTDALTITVCGNIKGDANHDCVVDIMDALFVINTILELHEPEPDQSLRIDCNGPSGNCDGDGVVNILDAVKIVNLILGLDDCP